MMPVRQQLARATLVQLGRCVLPPLALVMIMFEPAAPAQTSDAIFYVATYVDVQPGSTNQGIALIAHYREAGRLEAGNSGIDVVQDHCLMVELSHIGK